MKPSGELHYWPAHDSADETECVIVSPSKMASLRPNASARFQAAHRDRPDHPGVLPCRAWGAQKGRDVAALPPHTPLPSLALPADEALSLLDWLIPAVAASDQALGGELDGSDLAQTPDGSVLVNPSGVTRERSISQLPLHLAPEAQLGHSASTPAAALYGLGVCFFHAITGTHPVEARTFDELRSAQGRPRRVRDLMPDVDPELDQLVTDLIHPDPSVRMSASEGRPAVTQPPIVTRLTHTGRLDSAPSSPQSTELHRQTMPIKRWTLLLLPPAPHRSALRRIAAQITLFPSQTATALEGGLPVAVGSFGEQSEAQALLDQLEEPSATLKIVYTGHLSGSSWLLTGSGIGSLGLGIAAALSASISPPIAIGFAACLLSGGISGLRLWAQARQSKQIYSAMRISHARVDIPEPIAAARERVMAGHRALTAAQLPELIELELGASLMALEDELDSLMQLSASALKTDPARSQVSRIAHAAEAIEAATRTSIGGDSSEAVQQALRRADAAARTLKTP